MKGLTDKTYQIFESVSKMESIKPYVLVGGTALNLQIGARESEDLDFMRWKQVGCSFLLLLFLFPPKPLNFRL